MGRGGNGNNQNVVISEDVSVARGEQSAPHAVNGQPSGAGQWDANSPNVSGTPYTEQQLEEYANHLIEINHLKRGDVMALNMTNTSQIAVVEGLMDAAARKGIITRVLVDPNGDSNKLAEQAKQAIAENACYVSLQTFTPEGADAVEAGTTIAYHNEEGQRIDPLAALGKASSTDNDLRWNVAMWPSPAWAKSVYPELAPEQAYHQLGQDLLEFARCAPGSTAWEEHIGNLKRRAETLNERGIQSVNLKSEGTDLTMNVLPQTKIMTCDWETKKGDKTCVNAPTEEVFLTPDPKSVNGHFTASKPFMVGGVAIDGVKGRFEDGRLVEIEGNDPRFNEFLTNTFVNNPNNDGLAFIGELGLVDQSGPIAKKNRIYNNGIIDENAGCHFGMGQFYDVTLTEAAREAGITGNQAGGAHMDFIIGNDKMDVTAVDKEGNTLSLIDQGLWTF
jgi:leucyl aminopeptidase (aminopeptidase T)